MKTKLMPNCFGQISQKGSSEPLINAIHHYNRQLELQRRNDYIEFLTKFCTYLESNGYIDSDWREKLSVQDFVINSGL